MYNPYTGGIDVTTMSRTQPEVLVAQLEGRVAYCSCGRSAPSSIGLAFFTYRGVGSAEHHMCNECFMNDVAHLKVNPVTGKPGVTDHEFSPRPASDADSYYCGCRGWD